MKCATLSYGREVRPLPTEPLSFSTFHFLGPAHLAGYSDPDPQAKIFQVPAKC